MGIYLCSYATEDFSPAQKFQRRVALNLGFDDVFMFGPDQLSERFKHENRETLRFSRGSGYWVWKPEIILQASGLVKGGDTLIYLDSGVLPCLESTFYENLSMDGLIHLWSEPTKELPKNHNWIDLNVAQQFELNDLDLNSTHYLGGIICFLISETNLKVLYKWRDLCQNPNLLRPDSFTGYKPNPGLIWHRHDQSLLNVLVLKQPAKFNLHSPENEFGKNNSTLKLFLIHRRGRISNVLQLKLFLVLRKIKRALVKIIPSMLLPNLNFFFMSRSKKDTVTLTEIKAHSSSKRHKYTHY